MIKKELFREDLYYRISVFPIIVPPLRDRKEDISLLAGHFITKNARRLNSSVKGISPKAMDQLTAYPWPGNVRELENSIQHAMVSTRAELITSFPELRHVALGTQAAPTAIFTEEPTILVDAGEGNDYHTIKQTLLEQFERKYLAHLLEKHGGVIAEAARESGLNYKTFYLKVEKYQLTKKRERMPQ
jgi:DNA-binding NtrC family response regulator